MTRARRMLFVVEHGSGWTGGIYYVRNLIDTLLHNPKVREWELLVLCPDEHRDIFAPLVERGNVRLLRRSPLLGRLNFALMKAFRALRMDFPMDVALTALRHRVDAIFPVMGYPIFLLERRCVHWIPDFQHNKIPGFFSPRERIRKDSRFEAIGKSRGKLILSSQDAASHLSEFFPDSTVDVFVIPFISDIEEWAERITPELERDVLAKFGLLQDGHPVPYLYVPNQFWMHKNHITAFRGFAEHRRRHPDSHLTLVCTGNIQDYRHVRFFEDLQRELAVQELGDSVRILSFLERQEQVAILKRCRALLQPSLFEGWGTGVQEAKRFARPLLLSDLPIHREQGSERSFFFSPTDPIALADAIDALEEANLPDPPEHEIRGRYFQDAEGYAKDAHLLIEAPSP